MLIQDVEATVSAFRALKSLGIRLAIDDFGTGYSSLSYLRQFPIDTLKIDRSFVHSLDDSDDSQALVRSILDLSSTLRLEAVAEGIETSEQHDVLRSLGAQRGQGYLFATADATRGSRRPPWRACRQRLRRRGRKRRLLESERRRRTANPTRRSDKPRTTQP